MKLQILKEAFEQFLTEIDEPTNDTLESYMERFSDTFTRDEYGWISKINKHFEPFIFIVNNSMNNDIFGTEDRPEKDSYGNSMTNRNSNGKPQDFIAASKFNPSDLLKSTYTSNEFIVNKTFTMSLLVNENKKRIQNFTDIKGATELEPHNVSVKFKFPYAIRNGKPDSKGVENNICISMQGGMKDYMVAKGASLNIGKQSFEFTEDGNVASSDIPASLVKAYNEIYHWTQSGHSKMSDFGGFLEM